MSLEIPDKVRELQIKLYRKAKSEPEFRFYLLYDKVYRTDVLLRAWTLAKANDGAPGVDGQTFKDIESEGAMEWLNGLGKELPAKGAAARISLSWTSLTMCLRLWSKHIGHYR